MKHIIIAGIVAFVCASGALAGENYTLWSQTEHANPITADAIYNQPSGVATSAMLAPDGSQMVNPITSEELELAAPAEPGLQLNVTNIVGNLTTNEQQQTAIDTFFKGLMGTLTNWSVNVYATYAPKAPTKYGGGAVVFYNISQYVGAGAGVDWLGSFSLISVNVTLQAPFHLSTVLPAALNGSWDQNVMLNPFVLTGLGTASTGNGHFNGTPMVIADVGGYIEFGHFLGGRFDGGVAWGKWIGQGPYAVARYHAFIGMAWGI